MSKKTKVIIGTAIAAAAVATATTLVILNLQRKKKAMLEAEALDEADDELFAELEAAEEEVAEEACPARKKFQITPEQKEKLIATVKANKNVIIAVAATATVSAIIASNAAKRRKAKIRRNILDLLY
jgi:hypothetical protein